MVVTDGKERVLGLRQLDEAALAGVFSMLESEHHSPGRPHLELTLLATLGGASELRSLDAHMNAIMSSVLRPQPRPLRHRGHEPRAFNSVDERLGAERLIPKLVPSLLQGLGFDGEELAICCDTSSSLSYV